MDKFKIISIDPSFEGLAWTFCEVDLIAKNFKLLDSGCKEIPSKCNKYKAVHDYMAEVFSKNKADQAILEGQFFKVQYCIVGSIYSAIPDSVLILNSKKKNDLNPKQIRKIVKEDEPIKTKDDVEAFLAGRMKTPSHWTHDIRDSFMVLLAYLKNNYGLTLENFEC